MLRYLFLSLLWLIYGCTGPEAADPYAHITDQKARALIQTSIEQAGGLDKWQSIHRLRYTKDFELFREDSSVEKSYRQVHDYRFDADYLSILSIENGDTIHTWLEEGVYHRTRNGETVEADQQSLEKAMNTSTYVVGMPFKLVDPGAQISYLGEKTLAGGQKVEAIEVAYDAEAHANHSSTDVWRYYFDPADGRILANWVDAGDHYSLVENQTTVREQGILFNRDRESYRVDSLGNKLWLRASYRYDNYQID